MQRPPPGADHISFKSNVFWCMIYGLGGGVALTVLVTVLFLFGGTEPFDKQGVSFAAVVAFYLVGGAAGGLVAGILWPLTKWRAGAYLVGLLVALIVSIGLMYVLAGNPLNWDIGVIITILIMTAIYGLYTGYQLWKYVQDK